MHVSIVVPAYGRVEWLRECLLSALRQTYSDFTLIVVDDGSIVPLVEQPELTEIADDRRVAFLRKPHGGPASARNLGLDSLGDDHVLMLDSDDVLEPTAIENLLGALLQSGAEFAAGAWANFTPDSRTVFVPKLRYRDSYANYVDHGWVPGSVLIKNSRQARYNETRMPWEAFEFFLDYLAPGRSAVYLDHVIVNMRQHQDPNRLTIKHDHFEPFNTGSFFAEKKRELVKQSLMNLERASALDARILGCVHSLLRVGRSAEAKDLFAAVSWNLMGRYPWPRRGSFAWSSKHFRFLGAKSFIAVNRLIGRA